MENSLQGNLAHFSLSEILLILAERGRTGLLRLIAGVRETHAWLDGGTIVFATSNQEQMRMPAVLARRGKLTKDLKAQIEQLAAREGDRFAQAAIKQGILSADKIRELSAEYVRELVIDALLWETGSFAFSLDLALPDAAVPVTIGVDDVLDLGAKRLAEWQECQKFFPDPTTPYQVMGDPEADDKITLSVQQFKMLLKIKELGSASVEQLCRSIDRDTIEVYRTMDSLRQGGLIVEAPRVAAVIPEPPPVLAVPPVPPPPEPSRIPIAPPPIEPEAAETAPSPVAPPPSEPPPPEQDIPTAVADWRDQLTHPAPEPEATVATPLAKPPIPPPAPPPETKSSGESLIGLLTFDNAERTSFPLFEAEYSLGREPNNMIQVPDSSVSGAHARVRKTPEGYLLEDLNSRNGTYVNGERIQSRLLRNDDKIRLGKVHMIFNLPTEMISAKTTAPGDRTQ